MLCFSQFNLQIGLMCLQTVKITHYFSIAVCSGLSEKRKVMADPFVYACNHHKTFLIHSSARMKISPTFWFLRIGKKMLDAYGALMYCFKGKLLSLTEQLADICLSDESDNHLFLRERGWPATDNHRQTSPDPHRGLELVANYSKLTLETCILGHHQSSNKENLANLFLNIRKTVL